MTTRIYASTDDSAPSLSGSNNALLTVLDACLVNGYGSKSPAGWTKAFIGSQKAAYRQGAGSMAYIRVDDSLGLYAIVTGSIGMTSIDDLGRDFPSKENATLYSTSYGVQWRKSNTADAAARRWILIADEKTFYLFIDSGLSTAPGWTPYGFGEFASFQKNDPYPLFIAGSIVVASTNQASSLAVIRANSTTVNTYNGSYTASDVYFSKTSAPCSFFYASQFDESALPVPGKTSAIESGNYFRQEHYSDVLVSSAPYSTHGALRGIVAPSHMIDSSLKNMTGLLPLSFDELPVVSSTGGGFVAAKKYKVIPIVGFSTSIRHGALLVDIGDWS